jgi:hypothetical protein
MKNIGVKYGFWGALTVVGYFVIVYLMGKNHFINPFLQWFPMLFYIGFMYIASKEDLAKNGESRDFREIIRTPFVVFLLINLGFWMFYYGLHLFDPELLKLETAAQIASIKKQLNEGVGDPEQSNQMREQLQYLEKEGMLLPLGPVVSKMAMGAIGGFGLAAIISSINRGFK